MDIEECKTTYNDLKKSEFVIESIDKEFFFKFAETVLNELEKQNRIINFMAKTIREDRERFYSEET